MEAAREPGVQFDFMQVTDLDGVMAVEQLSFQTPWSRQAFVQELTQNQYALYLVARAAGTVVGYVGTWIVLDEAHVTNVAVHPGWRGRGIGERLMLRLIAEAVLRRAVRMTLEVRTNNTAAQNLYGKLGFKPAGIRKGYYTDTKEDALIMWKDPLV